VAAGQTTHPGAKLRKSKMFLHELTVMHTHILIPTDGSDLSAGAIQYGTALAKAVNAPAAVAPLNCAQYLAAFAEP